MTDDNQVPEGLLEQLDDMSKVLSHNEDILVSQFAEGGKVDGRILEMVMVAYLYRIAAITAHLPIERKPALVDNLCAKLRRFSAQAEILRVGPSRENH